MAFGYDPVIHQLEFSRKFDLEEARANPSFNRFYRTHPPASGRKDRLST